MQNSSRLILASITTSRAIYALSWFNLAAAFPAMSVTLHYSIQDLGLLTAVFLLGTGICQVPSGFVSARIGPARTTLMGMAIISVTSVGTGLVTDIQLQLLIRFLTGIGAALYFSPALAIASSTMGEHRSGFALGVYNGSYQVGGGAALFFFTPLAAMFDWRLPFYITALLSFIALVENYAAFRKWVEPPRAALTGVRRAITSRDIWIAVTATIGVSSAFYVLIQYAVSYSEGVLNYSPYLAGLISALMLVGALVGAPLWGALSDKWRNRRTVIFLTAVSGGLSISLFALTYAAIPWVAAFLSGFFVLGSTTLVYSYPIMLPEISKRFAPISIGLMNGTGILGGGLATAVAATMILLLGYPNTWIILAVISLVLAPLIYLSREPYRIQAKEQPHPAQVN